MKSRHHRSEGASEHLGNLPIGECLDVGQEEENPVLGREGAKRAQKVVVEKFLERKRRGVRAGGGGLDFLEREGLRPPSATPVEMGVAEDGEEPGLESSPGGTELGEAAEGLEIRLLNEIESVRLVALERESGEGEIVPQGKGQGFEFFPKVQGLTRLGSYWVSRL